MQVGGGLEREGSLFLFWCRGKGLIREGGLKERQLNSAFTVLKFLEAMLINVQTKSYTREQIYFCVVLCNKSFYNFIHCFRPLFRQTAKRDFVRSNFMYFRYS